MKCLSTVRYCINVNGDYSNHIYPQQGLRQGDPLSPYLFILCAEGLSAMLQRAQDEGKLRVLECAGQPQELITSFLQMIR